MCRSVGTLLGLLGVVLVSAGCGDFSASMDSAVKRIFEPKRTPQQYMIIAVSDVDPDVRRNAAAKVADSKKFDEDWAIKGFRTIALLESDGQTRCVAVRALAQTNDPRAIETFLKLLNYQKHPATEVRPPDALCRWDAAEALADKSGGVYPDEYRSETEKTFLDLLRLDKDRNVRIEAARGLRNYSSPLVVRGLVAGLRDEDFAVIHECEMSLAFLTGVTFDCDAYAWEQWVQENEGALFAQGGELPESRQAPYDGKWSHRWYNTKQFFRWMFPGKKEK